MEAFTINWEPKMDRSTVIVSWTEDAGKLGPSVIDYINRSLRGREFAELNPFGFFSLGGVSIHDDVAQFPEAKFYCCESSNVVTFMGSPPEADWYRFLESLVDIAQNQCHATHLYTVGGMLASSAHTNPRPIVGVGDSPEMTTLLGQNGVATGFDYETPAGQRPTLSSYLLWVAKRRNLPAASLWVPLPFYLAAGEDPKACREALAFFDRTLELRMDLSAQDQEIRKQDGRIAELRGHLPEIDEYIGRLEKDLTLSQEENEKLIKEVDKYLRQR